MNTSTAAYSPIDKIGNRMMFTVLGSTNYWEMWSTDGTVAGTQFQSRLFASLGMLNGKFYYYATFDDQIANVVSYTSDGISSGTKTLSLPIDGIDGYINANKEMYLGSALGKALYHTTDFSDLKKIADLAQTNTYFLAATDLGLLYAKLLNYNISDEYTFYFASRDGGVKAVNTGRLFVSSQDTFAFKNTFYTPTSLKTDTQIYGRELWRMDDQHTELFKDIYPGFMTFSGYTFPNNASPKGFFSYNDEMYFLADQANGKKLFKFNPDFTFNNAGQDNKWSNPNNWNAGATPMLTDDTKLPSSVNVEIDGTAYTNDLQVSSPLNLTNGILNVSGNVTLESKIILNNSNLNLKGSQSKITGADTSNYVVTTGNSKVVVENLDGARGSVALPIGTANNYSPANISNGGVSDSFSFAVSEGINNAADKSLNVTWDISESTSGGSNVTLNLGWNQSQEQAGFQRNTAKIGHYKNGQWTEENSGSVSGNNPYSISATGIEASGFLSGGSSGMSVYLGCYTDELMSHGAATADVSTFYLLTHNAASARVLNIWTASYKQIYYINAIIEGLNESPMITASLRNKLMGECLFLRALIHSYLLKTFSGIPYIRTTDHLVNQTAVRNTESEVYQMAKDDLVQSLGLLPENYTKGLRVRPSKMAARALLARLSYEQKKWDDAIAYASEVISSPQYPMETAIEKTFLKDSSSAIWQLMPYDAGYNSQEGNYYILRTAPPTTISLSADFISGFEVNDARRSKWVAEIKDTSQKTYYYPFKYKQQTNTASTLEYSVVIRVEELYLIRAEAYLEKGQVQQALTDLNKIRSRVGLPVLTTTDKNILLDLILKERCYEFFTEWGQRFYDLKHFGKLDQKMIAAKPSWKSTFKYLPIPEKELLINPALNPQNDGY